MFIFRYSKKKDDRSEQDSIILITFLNSYTFMHKLNRFCCLYIFGTCSDDLLMTQAANMLTKMYHNFNVLISTGVMQSKCIVIKGQENMNSLNLRLSRHNTSHIFLELIKQKQQKRNPSEWPTVILIFKKWTVAIIFREMKFFPNDNIKTTNVETGIEYDYCYSS